jgi:predicted nucleic acid-binding protein
LVGAWIEDPDADLHVPAVCDLEMASLLCRLARANLVPGDRAEESLDLYLLLPLELHDERPLVPRIWSLRDNMTPYDACYVALAEVLEAPLLTVDGALAEAAVRHAGVEVVGL